MFSPPNGKVTVTQVLLPVSLMAFVLFIMLAFQTSQLLREHSNLSDIKNNQEEQFSQAQKVNNQLNALACGTKDFADKGNPSAAAIIERMKKIGITVGNCPVSATVKKAPAAAPKTAPAPKPADE